MNWIIVAEKQPAEEGRILVVSSIGEMFMASVYHSGRLGNLIIIDDLGRTVYMDGCSFWLPIPPLPDSVV